MRDRRSGAGVLLLVLLLRPIWLIRGEESRPAASSSHDVLSQAGRSLAEEDYEGVLRMLVPLREKMKQSAAYHGLLGFAYAKTSDPIAAIGELQKALQLEPANEGHYLDLAQVLGEYNANEAAVELLRWAVAAHPESARLQVGLALAYMPDGRMREAQLAAERALILEPNLETAYTTLAMVEEDSREWESLHGTAQRLLRINDGNYLGWYYLAQAQVEQVGESASPGTSTGLTSLKRAIALNPAFPLAHFQLGKLYLQEGEHHSAIQELSKVIELQPDYPQAHFLLGRALLGSGDIERAQEHMEVHRQLVAAERSKHRPRLDVKIDLPK